MRQSLSRFAPNQERKRVWPRSFPMKSLVGLLLSASLGVSQQPGLKPRPDRVLVEFQVDGTPRKAPTWIEFVQLNGIVHRETITGGAFSVPESMCTSVAVRLRFERRALLFEPVWPAKFEGKWIIGIDKPPFDPENDSDRYRVEKPKELWFISFQPSASDGTRIVVSVPRGRAAAGGKNGARRGFSSVYGSRTAI